MRRSCGYCGRTHGINEACPIKPPKRTRATLARKLRQKNEWRITKAQVNARDGYVCRVCLEAGTLSYENLETHHIIPIEEDASKAYAADNAITLCRGHHEEAENGEIMREKLFSLVAAPPRIEKVPPRPGENLWTTRRYS